MPTRSSARTPWDKKNPRTSRTGKKSKRLSTAQKREARGRARAAGRPYPNLVDNMAVARKKNTKKTTTKKKKKSGS